MNFGGPESVTVVDESLLDASLLLDDPESDEEEPSSAPPDDDASGVPPSLPAVAEWGTAVSPHAASTTTLNAATKSVDPSARPQILITHLALPVQWPRVPVLITG
jgi:hypothetical protein